MLHSILESFGVALNQLVVCRPNINVYVQTSPSKISKLPIGSTDLPIKERRGVTTKRLMGSEETILCKKARTGTELPRMTAPELSTHQLAPTKQDKSEKDDLKGKKKLIETTRHRVKSKGRLMFNAQKSVTSTSAALEDNQGCREK
uniref:Uncharacterized protein n=1 Tax=Nelumbo nucifera TaxID=4432 RepID=A0A822ZNU9_NELNU|nr:TPA_asm: hypothetical protein HUJ06_004370 [Nelumbo nucifera]